MTLPLPDRLSLMSYNVRIGIETSLAAVADAVRAEGVPDLLALQEIGDRWRMGERVDQPAFLARALGYRAHAFAGALTDAEGGRFGVAVLSRFPLRAADTSLLPQAKDEQRVALRLVLDTEPALTLVCTHLSIQDDERLAQARRLARLFEGVEGPRLLMGDLNDTPESPVHTACLAAGGFTDLFDAAGAGDPRTFSVKAPNRRIDYLMAAGGLVPDGTCRVAHGARASDHFPLCGAVRRLAGHLA